MEGIGTFIGGANSSVDPALLSPNQYSWGVNVSVRGGFPRTRPGFRFIKALPNGVIQGASYFKNNSSEQLMALISGRLYDSQVLDPEAAVLDVTPANESNNYVSRKASMVAANNYLVVQDGVNPAIVYTGFNSYRSQNILEELQSFVELEITMGANNPRINV
jgi:hypothetical protein